MAERDIKTNREENSVNRLAESSETERNIYDDSLFMSLEPPQADFSAPPPYEPSMDNIQYQDLQSYLPSIAGIAQQRPTSASVSSATYPISSDENLNLTSSTTGLIRHNYTDQEILPPPCGTLVSQRNLGYNYNHYQQFTDNCKNSQLPTYEEVELQKALTGDIFLPSLQFNPSYSSQRHYVMPFENERILRGSAIQNNHRARQQSNQTSTEISRLHEHEQNRVGHEMSSSAEGDSTTNIEENSSGSSPLTFVSVDSTETDNLSHGNIDYTLLGRDSIFATAFLAAFLFNWIGFLMITCFCNTVAARYGALSGFGLSLAKWTLIVKNSTELASYENSWLWWLIMVFGVLICVRAIVQYVSIKRAWRLLSANAQERLLFFY